jgi:1-acyl-sn-glycerol-3-phosphate acyltransferase
MVSLLARTEVTGREHFPAGGPLLVVGNHIAAMEVVLMVTYTPWQVELLGPGDLPPQRAIGVIAQLYGYTPIKRGHADRTALTRALDVLRQDGVVGLFPEGGIWDTGPRPARRGVAWLSYRAQAPILPIGFGGVKGALEAMFSFERPRLSMNVGQLIPPVTSEGRPSKAQLREAAAGVMEAVNRLIPEGERPQEPKVLDERFELQVVVRDGRGAEVAYPAGLSIGHADALCKFFYRPALLNIFRRDLYMPVDALQRLESEHDASQIADAVQAILDYLGEDNPYFFTYRFGREEGGAMQAGLEELHALAAWAAQSGNALHVTAIRRYRVPGRKGVVVESDPGQTYAW